MSSWDERIIGHSLHGALQQFRTAIGKASVAAEDADAVAAIARLRSVEGHISRILKSADPSLVSPATLQGIQTHVQNATNELNSFSSNKNAGHLTNANNHVDNTLPQVAGIPAVAQPVDVEGVQDAVVRFRRSAGQHLSKLEKRTADATATVKAVEKKVTDIDDHN